MFEKISGLIVRSGTAGHIGEIENIVGMSVEASGGRSNISDIVLVYNGGQNWQMPAEVVGFKDGRIQLITCKTTDGIASGSFIHNIRQRLKVPVGDFLEGRVINAMGRPIDGRNIFRASQHYTVNSLYTNPLNRSPTCDRLEFGIKTVDGLNTIGRRQRVGIFADSGAGKSTLMGTIAKNVKTDISVITLTEERGREVLEFVQESLGEEGMRRSVLVVATSDQPAILRTRRLLIVITIAEYFRDQGFDVLPMMGFFTCCTMARRKIGLAIGEPPIVRGYTPSTYAGLPKLLERSGNFSQGSMTGACTVLMEGDDTSEPIADMVRGILDGHIVLSRQLVNESHFPAIGTSANISRLMVKIVDGEYHRVSSRFRNMLGLYQKDSDPISIGAYKKGADVASDEAVPKINKMNAFLQQGIDERSSYKETPGFTKPIVG